MDTSSRIEGTDGNSLGNEAGIGVGDIAKDTLDTMALFHYIISSWRSLGQEGKQCD